MKGFFSFLLVVAGVSALLACMALSAKTSFSSGKADADALLLENAYYAQLDAKHAMLDSFKEEARSPLTARADSKELSKTLVMRLAALENFLGSNFHGFQSLLWCGNPIPGELDSLANEMALAGKPLKCGACSGMKDRVPEANPVTEEVDLVPVCSYHLLIDRAGKKIFLASPFGISLYDPKANASFIYFIPGGTAVDYS